MLHFGIHDQIKVLTSCGYWETFTSEHSWTRVGQWLYEVDIQHILYAIYKDLHVHNLFFFQVKAEMVLGKLVQKDTGNLATDMDGNLRTVR